MVRTRSGHDVFYTEASYGRAARKETARRRQKRKLSARPTTKLGDSESGNATPQRPQTTRARIQREQDLATPPSAHSRVGATPPRITERILRGRLPTCSDYGNSRHFLFQGSGFFFCHACDLWDSLPPDRHKRAARSSARLACTANHESFSHPTTFCKDYCRRGAIMLIDANDSSGDSTDSSCSSTTTGTGGGGGLDDEQDNDDAHLDSNYGVDCNEAAGVKNTSSTIFQASDYSRNSTDHNEAQNIDTLQRTLREKEQELEKMRGKMVFLKEKLQDMARKNKVLEDVAEGMKQFGTTTTTASPHATYLHTISGGHSSTTSRNDGFKIEVLEAIKNVVRMYPRWSSKRTASLVAQALWNQDVNLPELLRLSRKHFRDKVFTPYNVLREMDLAGGTLSYEGIDVLRRVETAGLKRFRGSMIPSKSEIKRMAGMVEWFAREYCPFVLKETTRGESVEFNYAKAMLCITRAFHLDEVGKIRSLSVASSIDGASLTKNLSIIAGGIKITDRGARCPLTRQPLLDNPTTMRAQSRNLCIPLKIMMGRETKETFAEFASLFSFLDNLAAVETFPLELAGFMPFRCMTNCDLSAQWKGLCKGGAAKVHTLPCTGCATESDCLATPNAQLCARWCYEHSLVDPGWMCFHREMATPERVSSIKTEVAELLSVLGSALEEIKANSKMTSDDVEIEVPLVSSTTNATSIHFLPKNALEMRSFSQLLSNELMLRNLDNGGSIATRRESLRDSLKGESTIVRLTKEIEHGDVREGAYFLLMNTLPCVLHMENRNGIKLLTMILIEGLSNAKKKLLYLDINAEGSRVSRFVSDIESIVNRSILGSDDDPCQWLCPFDTKKKEFGPITMDNVRTRRVVDSLDILVDFCVRDPVRASLWTTTLNNYRIAMVLLRKREDFTNAEIATYQSHADKFFQAWVRLWQKEGVTNYIHMIGAGHIADYLYRWRNLYRYSQQGWEAMNSLVKTFFFRRTNHGGGVRGCSKKSKLIPIARWLQRRLIFLCRATEGNIRQYKELHPMPKVYRTQMVSSDNDVYE